MKWRQCWYSQLQKGSATKLERGGVRSVTRILYSRTPNSVTRDTKTMSNDWWSKTSLCLKSLQLKMYQQGKALRFRRRHYYRFWHSHILGVWLGAARDKKSRICRFMFHCHWARDDHIHSARMAFAWSRELRYALTTHCDLGDWGCVLGFEASVKRWQNHYAPNQMMGTRFPLVYVLI